MADMDRVVVIGAGQAGASLVAKLRAEGFVGAITLVGGEAVPPYQRPPLSKAYLLGEMVEERLYLRPRDWYTDQGIDLRLSTRAVAVDRLARTVTLDDDTVLSYDALALTTGAHPRPLPDAMGGALGNVFTVRDLRDADAMSPHFDNGKRALVIGGGYIGLEAAAVAAKRGVEVTLVEMADRILQRVAAPETSDYFRTLHASHGVDIREGIGLNTLVGKQDVRAARLADGSEIEVDFVVVGIGITPATILADAAGLDVSGGIVTDAFCRTSDPLIWAAGDCAACTVRGQTVRIESVGNAIDQGENAAMNMLGRKITYQPKPWFWSDQYDCKLQIAGLNLGYDSVHVRPGETEASQSHWYYKGPELIAVDAMNDPRNYMIGKRLIEAGKSPTPEVIIDPATDMKALLRA